MERLDILRAEFQQIKTNLCFPLSFAERYRLYDRRQEILAEARELARSLNIAGDQWFNRDEETTD